ncbi:MAG TPA: DUF1697 domain-containing protein [Streptosporangiaceae bacterium]|jgi:uncharacterized protein (DUF1697 family)
MATHVALLRGINVGGHNKVAMADLREITAALGHTEIVTYIQSGNVVWTSEETDAAAMADGLAGAIQDRLGLRPGVVVLSRDELAEVIAANPYPDEDNPKYLHAVFRREPWTPQDAERVAAAVTAAGAKGSRDEATVAGRVLYLRTPDGLGRSELAVQLAKSGGAMAAKAGGTARNWATVTRLLALADG